MGADLEEAHKRELAEVEAHAEAKAAALRATAVDLAVALRGLYDLKHAHADDPDLCPMCRARDALTKPEVAALLEQEGKRDG